MKMVADPTAKRIKSRQTELGSTLLYPCWFRVFFIWNKLKGSVAMLTAWKGTVPARLAISGNTVQSKSMNR
jgi:hypothetical protein